MVDTHTQEYGPDPLVGALIDDRYRIHGVLGEGGMGTVYVATQRDLERDVAIKVMAPEVAVRATAIQRFKREAKAVGKLGHPNLVDIFDVGRLDDGRPYLVMPRLSGRDLATVLDEDGPQPLARVVELLRGPAAALDLMHDKGIIHRDIKPENLMIHRCANGEEIVKLLDFGLVDITSRDLTRLTGEGMVSGTPHYVSPEGAMGRRVDGRADVYSLAVVAFELIAGGVPIDGLSAVAVLRRKTREEPPTLASRGARVSDEVEQVMARGLARRRSDRYERAGQMFADLARALEDHAAPHGTRGAPQTEPERIVPDWALDEPTPIVDEEPVDPPPMRAYPLVLGIVVALALILGVGALLAFDSDGGPAPSRTVARQSDPEAPVPLATPDMARGVDAPTVARPEPAEAPPVSPRVRGDPARALPPAALAEPLAAPPPDLTGAERHTRAGTRALLEGLAPNAIEHFREATVAAPDHAPAWRGLGLANQRLGRPAEARLAFERYLALQPQARDADAIRARLAGLEDR